MPKYVVIWADKAGVNPGDDFAPLNIPDHPEGGFFWFQEYVEAAAKRELDFIPAYWWKVAGFKSSSRLVEASSPADLRAKVAAIRDWTKGWVGKRGEE
jgi:hypothetical protein